MKHRHIRKVLIANRGEIACRVIRACRELDISPVAVYSDADESAVHVQMADEAYPLGGKTPAESYLNGEKIIALSLECGADAIHPGYGFLSENAGFVERVEHAGQIFIGPSSSAIRALGDKASARRLAAANGIPVVPGSPEPVLDVGTIRTVADEIGYPILLKAAAGGGGKGMRIVENELGLEDALRVSKSEAKTAFGDDRVLVEKYISHPRHVEIQVLGDRTGKLIHLGERECSIQRRHQKVVEESPSPIVTPALRQSMGECAGRLAKAGGYENAGTVEFIVDANGSFFFLEMNTRLQVEHPTTEWVTGVDIVREQIRIASGEPLSTSQAEVESRGWSIECRVCAEDPVSFYPSSGRLTRLRFPGGPFVRVENGYQEGDEVSVFYDSLLAKIIVWGPDRNSAVSRMRRALGECDIAGVQTNVDFCRFVMQDQAFVSGTFDTHFVGDRYANDSACSNLRSDAESTVILAALARLHGRSEASGRKPPTDNDRKEDGWTRRRMESYR